MNSMYQHRLSDIAKTVILCLGISVLTGCATSTALNKEVDQSAGAAQQKTSQIYDNYAQTPDSAKVGIFDHPGYYLKEVTRNALWLQQQVYISGTMTLNHLLTQILSGSQVSYNFTGGADADRRMNGITFDGNVKQALDYISTLTGYHYTINDNTITFSDITTETYYINAVPGQSSFGMGQSQSQYTIGSVSSSGSDSSGSSSGGDSQFSKMDGKIDHWEDVRNALQNLASHDGKITITQSDAAVTVTDHWTNLETISRWIKNYNDQLHKQISFKVQILTVQLNHEYAQGIDWTGIIKGANVAYNSGLGFASVLDSGITSALTGTGSTLSIQNSRYTMLINSLQQQGKVTVDQEPIITSLNNEAAEVKDLINTAYLQTVQNTVIPTGDSTTSQNTLTPGNIITGLEIHLLPHITQTGDIFLRVSAGLGDLTGIQQVGTVTSGNGIQLPTIDLREFNQNAVLKNGQTLIIAGFKINTHKNDGISHFDINALGASSALSNSTELVLLITPQISDTQG